MGARKCIVAGCLSCTNRPEDSGVTFHRFPTNSEFTKKWLKAAGFPLNFNPGKGHHICSRHFCRSDFQDFKGKKYFLKQGAVPSIFPAVNSTEAIEINDEILVKDIEKVQDEAAKDEEKVVDNVEVQIEKSEKLEKSIITEESPVEIIPAALSPKKKRRSAPIKRYSDTSAAQEPAKKVSKRSSLSKIKEKEDEETKFLSKEKLEEKNEKLICQPSPKKKNQIINFVPGNTIEAQDFDGKWISVKVIEVDTEDREVLVRFEKSSKASRQSGMNEEWIPMDSSRLRSAQPAITFEVGEKCLARWNDCRKFPATIQRVLENDSYEVLFDDGYVKVVRGIHINKVPNKSLKPGQPCQPILQPIVLIPPPSLIPDYVKNTPIPEVINDGEWCCAWVDDIPIGEESSFDGPHGKVSSILVPDKRLRPGWIKHFYLRPTGKWDVVFISPTGKKLRFKHELRAYLEEIGEPFDSEAFDFSLHKKRSKALGLYIYSDKLKQASVMQIDANHGSVANLSQQSINHLANLGALPTIPSAVATGASIIPIESEINIGSLKVKVIDNLFRCPQDKCGKTFRNQNHLQIHIKHYHRDISKLMGVCPNMTDLAYLRTTGDESEVPIAKVKSPTSTVTKKSMTVKIETSDVEMPIEVKKEIKSNLCPTVSLKKLKSPILEEALKAPPITQPMKIKDETIKTEIKTEIDIKPTKIEEDFKKDFGNMVDAESLITSHAVSKSGVVKTSTAHLLKKRSKFRFGIKSKKSLKKRRFGFSEKPLRKPSIVKKVGTMTSSSDSTFYPPSKKRKGIIQGMIPFQGNNPSNLEGTIGYDSQSSFVDENGEVIKIVRMKKEEIINCICGFGEEDGLMIQCELCLCWQHGGCNAIYKENQVPDKYVCYICKYPLKARKSQRFIHDQDWLYDGKLPIGNYHLPSQKQTARFEKLKQYHTLVGNLREMEKFMHSLKVKKNIAEKRDHPKMYLWSKKWESSPTRQIQNNSIDENGKKNVVKKELKFEEDEKPQMVIPSAPEPEAAIDPAKCQRTLINHLEKQIKEAKSRYDTIEEQVTVWETMEDQNQTKLLDNDTKIKQTIFMLLNDLTKMQNIASIHATTGV